MRILYFGDPAGGNALLQRGLEIVGVVHGQRGGVGLRRFMEQIRTLPRWSLPDFETVLPTLAALEPDLLVAGFYPRKIPTSVLALAPGINVHPSDLPRWRGPDPCSWAIRAGDEETAICVHWLTEGVDEGDVLLRSPIPIGAQESAGQLAQRLQSLGAELLADVALEISSGQTPSAHPQRGEISWAPLTDENDWEIDWSLPSEIIHRFVRAASPDPGAYTGIGQELLVILDSAPAMADAFSALPPGTPFVRGNHALIRCGEGALKLKRVRLGRRLLSGSQLARLLV